MKTIIQNPTPPHVVYVGLIKYNGKVYCRETRTEIEIKVHHGNKYVNYKGSRYSISKLPDFDPDFDYLFEYGWRNKPNPKMEAYLNKLLPNAKAKI